MPAYDADKGDSTEATQGLDQVHTFDVDLAAFGEKLWDRKGGPGYSCGHGDV